MDRPARVRRRFLWNGQIFADPDPALTPEQVRDHFSQRYPELTTAAVVSETTENAKTTITFGKAPAKPAASTRKVETHTFVNSQGKRG